MIIEFIEGLDFFNIYIGFILDLYFYIGYLYWFILDCRVSEGEM